jgi:aminopeptidase N
MLLFFLAQVAIPDFNSGAMENWGLVFYREASLLYNQATDTIKNKRRVSEVVAHELAHQWVRHLDVSFCLLRKMKS